MDLTPILRLLARRRIAAIERLDAAAAQTRVLQNLVGRAASTRFGRDHDFGAIRTVADFQARVPVRDFDALWNDYWKSGFPILDDVTWPGRIPFFARSSGTTTGRTKHLPITREIIKANERVGFALMSYHLAHNPSSRPLKGRSFIVGGTTALEETEPGIWVGDVSGINTKLTPRWVRSRIFPGRDLAVISNWDEKLETLSGAVQNEPITMLSGMCNWALMMLDRVRERREAQGPWRGPTFPDLQLFIHAGVPIDPYRERIEAHLAGGRTDLRELYPASEGFIAYADRGPGEGLRMMLDNPLFLEFIPMSEFGTDNPTRHWAATVEPDVDYALVLSNNAGLWSYVIGDVVRFVDVDPPRLLIMGRVSQQLNAFGEHLIGAEIEEAVTQALAAAGIALSEYTVGPVLPLNAGSTGYHVYIIEPTAASHGVAAAAQATTVEWLDRVLSESNYDYARKRTGGSGLAPPRVHFVAPGTFETWMRAQGKMGGQNKVPRVTASVERFATVAAGLGVDPGIPATLLSR